MAVSDGEGLGEIGLHAVAAELAQCAVVKGELEGVADQFEFAGGGVVGADVADGGVNQVCLLRRSHGVGLGDGVGVAVGAAEQQGSGELAGGVAVVIQQGCDGRSTRFG